MSELVKEVRIKEEFEKSLALLRKSGKNIDVVSLRFDGTDDWEDRSCTEGTATTPTIQNGNLQLITLDTCGDGVTPDEGKKIKGTLTLVYTISGGSSIQQTIRGSIQATVAADPPP